MICNFITKIICWLTPFIYAKELKLLVNEILYLKAKFNKQNDFAIPMLLTNMLVVAEDRRFFLHAGVDFHAILRAIRNNIFYKKFEGASTIQQQLTRVLINDYELSYTRKVKEIFLAATLHLYLARKEILSLYLFRAYYGLNGNGLVQICNTLHYDLDKLSLFEAASIVARLKYPQAATTNYLRNKQILQRTNHILLLYHKTLTDYKNSLRIDNEIIYTQ